jgi:hypothetical protein
MNQTKSTQSIASAFFSAFTRQRQQVKAYTTHEHQYAEKIQKQLDESIDPEILKGMMPDQRVDMMISIRPSISLSMFVDGKMILKNPKDEVSFDEVLCSLKNIINMCECDVIGQLLFWNNFQIFSKKVAEKYKLSKITYTQASLQTGLSMQQMSEQWTSYISTAIDDKTVKICLPPIVI